MTTIKYFSLVGLLFLILSKVETDPSSRGVFTIASIIFMVITAYLAWRKK